MKKQKGFSIIELLIVLIIVAVLALTAMPIYKDYSLRSHRIDARNALQTAAQKLHLYFVANKKYPTQAEADAMLLKYELDRSPANGNKRYSIKLDIKDVNVQRPVTDSTGKNTIEDVKAKDSAYILVAKAEGRQEKDKCKYIILHSNGIKEAHDAKDIIVQTDGRTSSNKPMHNECWR